jgi:hypothetical protein
VLVAAARRQQGQRCRYCTAGTGPLSCPLIGDKLGEFRALGLPAEGWPDLLAMPVAELAGPARERVSRAVHRAAAQGEDQLAAVLLLAQSKGFALTP